MYRYSNHQQARQWRSNTKIRSKDIDDFPPGIPDGSHLIWDDDADQWRPSRFLLEKEEYMNRKIDAVYDTIADLSGTVGLDMARLASLLDQAPHTMDTLKEVADVLGDPTNLGGNIINQLVILGQDINLNLNKNNEQDSTLLGHQTHLYTLDTKHNNQQVIIDKNIVDIATLNGQLNSTDSFLLNANNIIESLVKVTGYLEIENFDSFTNNFKRHFDTVDNEIITLQGRSTSLETRMTNKDNNDVDHSSRIATLETEMATEQDATVDMTNRITQNEDDISVHTNRLNTVDGRLDSKDTTDSQHNSRLVLIEDLLKVDGPNGTVIKQFGDRDLGFDELIEQLDNSMNDVFQSLYEQSQAFTQSGSDSTLRFSNAESLIDIHGIQLNDLENKTSDTLSTGHGKRIVDLESKTTILENLTSEDDLTDGVGKGHGKRLNEIDALNTSQQTSIDTVWQSIFGTFNNDPNFPDQYYWGSPGLHTDPSNPNYYDTSQPLQTLIKDNLKDIADLKTLTTSINTKTDTRLTQQTNNTNQLVIHSADLTSKQISINQHQATLGAHDTRLDWNETKRDNHEARIVSLEDLTQLKFADHEDRLDHLDASMNFRQETVLQNKARIDYITNDAPEMLDTLKELADILGDNDLAASVTLSISNLETLTGNGTTGHSKLITDLTDRLDVIDGNSSGRIFDIEEQQSINTVDIIALQNKATSLEDKTSDTLDTGHGKRIFNLETNVSTLDGHKTSHNTRITSLETLTGETTTGHTKLITDLTDRLDLIDGAESGRIKSIENRTDTLESRANDFDTKFTTKDTEIVDIKARATSLETLTGITNFANSAGETVIPHGKRLNEIEDRTGIIETLVSNDDIFDSVNTTVKIGEGYGKRLNQLETRAETLEDLNSDTLATGHGKRIVELETKNAVLENLTSEGFITGSTVLKGHGSRLNTLEGGLLNVENLITSNGVIGQRLDDYDGTLESHLSVLNEHESEILGKQNELRAGRNIFLDSSDNTIVNLYTNAAKDLNELEDVIFNEENFKDSLLIGSTTTGILSNADNNIGIGRDVFSSLTTGDSNIGIGVESISSLQSGEYNISIGTLSSKMLVTGDDNISIGHQSLEKNTESSNNIAIGSQSLQKNINNGNIGIGNGSGTLNQTGYDNIFIGRNSNLNVGGIGNNPVGQEIHNSVAIGYNAKIGSSNHIQLGNSNILTVNTVGRLKTGQVTWPKLAGQKGRFLIVGDDGVIEYSLWGNDDDAILERFLTAEDRIKEIELNTTGVNTDTAETRDVNNHITKIETLETQKYNLEAHVYGGTHTDGTSIIGLNPRTAVNEENIVDLEAHVYGGNDASGNVIVGLNNRMTTAETNITNLGYRIDDNDAELEELLKYPEKVDDNIDKILNNDNLLVIVDSSINRIDNINTTQRTDIDNLLSRTGILETNDDSKNNRLNVLENYNTTNTVNINSIDNQLTELNPYKLKVDNIEIFNTDIENEVIENTEHSIVVDLSINRIDRNIVTINNTLNNITDLHGMNETLNTLNTLNDLLTNDENTASSFSNLIATKAPIHDPTFTGTVSGITKDMINLNNVDNISDINKPISTAQQTAFDEIDVELSDISDKIDKQDISLNNLQNNKQDNITATAPLIFENNVLSIDNHLDEESINSLQDVNITGIVENNFIKWDSTGKLVPTNEIATAQSNISTNTTKINDLIEQSNDNKNKVDGLMAQNVDFTASEFAQNVAISKNKSDITSSLLIPLENQSKLNEYDKTIIPLMKLDISNNNNRIDLLTNGAPEALDTLKELTDYLGTNTIEVSVTKEIGGLSFICNQNSINIGLMDKELEDFTDLVEIIDISVNEIIDDVTNINFEMKHKQPTLTAGTGVTIDANNVIRAAFDELSGSYPITGQSSINDLKDVNTHGAKDKQFMTYDVSGGWITTSLPNTNANDIQTIQVISNNNVDKIDTMNSELTVLTDDVSDLQNDFNTTKSLVYQNDTIVLQNQTNISNISSDLSTVNDTLTSVSQKANLVAVDIIANEGKIEDFAQLMTDQQDTIDTLSSTIDSFNPTGALGDMNQDIDNLDIRMRIVENQFLDASVNALDISMILLTGNLDSHRIRLEDLEQSTEEQGNKINEHDLSFNEIRTTVNNNNENLINITNNLNRKQKINISDITKLKDKNNQYDASMNQFQGIEDKADTALNEINDIEDELTTLTQYTTDISNNVDDNIIQIALNKYLSKQNENRLHLLLDSAPETLDTLVELSEAINNDANVYDTLDAAIGLKANKIDPDFSGNIFLNKDKITNVYFDSSKIIGLHKNNVGLGNVENIKLSGWKGSFNINRVGKIRDGSWNAGVIEEGYGGTGYDSIGKFMTGEGLVPGQDIQEFYPALNKFGKAFSSSGRDIWSGDNGDYIYDLSATDVTNYSGSRIVFTEKDENGDFKFNTSWITKTAKSLIEKNSEEEIIDFLNLTIGEDTQEWSVPLDEYTSLFETMDSELNLLYVENKEIKSHNISDLGLSLLEYETIENFREGTGLKIDKDIQRYSKIIQDISGLKHDADQILYTSDDNIYSTTDISELGRTLIGTETIDELQETFELQPASQILSNINNVYNTDGSSNKIIYSTENGSFSLTKITEFGRDLLNITNQEELRSKYDIQVRHQELEDICEGNWVGDKSITTIGIITNGEWKGKEIEDEYIQSADFWNDNIENIKYSIGIIDNSLNLYKAQTDLVEKNVTDLLEDVEKIDDTLTTSITRIDSSVSSLTTKVNTFGDNTDKIEDIENEIEQFTIDIQLMKVDISANAETIDGNAMDIIDIRAKLLITEQNCETNMTEVGQIDTRLDNLEINFAPVVLDDISKNWMRINGIDDQWASLESEIFEMQDSIQGNTDDSDILSTRINTLEGRVGNTYPLGNGETTIASGINKNTIDIGANQTDITTNLNNKCVYSPLNVITYQVTMADKLNGHPNFGTGYNKGYLINGKIAAILEFIPGVTYKFVQPNTDFVNHPLRFYIDEAKTVQFSTNVLVVSSGGNTTTSILITDDTPSKLYYQSGGTGINNSGMYGTVKGKFNLNGAVKGSLAYHDGITWKHLPAGTVGKVLTMGSNGLPAWA